MALTPSTMLPLGTAAPGFALPNIDGSTVALSDFAGKPLLVVFMCNHCPFVKHLADKLAEVGRDLQDKGVAVVGISANDITTHPDDSPERMKAEAAKRGYTFPYLYDATQEVAKAYRAACTPDFFLFDADHKLVYRGQFDPTRPDKGQPSGRDVLRAVEALLGGQGPLAEQLPSIGCNIKWRDGNAPEYA